MKKLLLTTLIAGASSAYAHDLFIENNSSCTLTKIGVLTSMPGAINNASATIGPHKTGKITVSSFKGGDYFSDVYRVKCAHETLEMCVFGESDVYGWGVELDANDSLTIANATDRDGFWGDLFEASYSQNRVVLANK